MQTFKVVTKRIYSGAVAYIVPVDVIVDLDTIDYDHLLRDYGDTKEQATRFVLYKLAGYCIKNSLTSDCIDTNNREQLNEYIAHIQKTGEFPR